MPCWLRHLNRSTSSMPWRWPHAASRLHLRLSKSSRRSVLSPASSGILSENELYDLALRSDPVIYCNSLHAEIHPYHSADQIFGLALPRSTIARLGLYACSSDSMTFSGVQYFIRQKKK